MLSYEIETHNMRKNCIRLLHNYSGGRVERAVTVIRDIPCNGQGLKIVFGIDTGRSCNHLKICQS